MEELNKEQPLKARRGRALNIILILSYIMLGFRFLGVTMQFANGEKSAEQLEQQQIDILAFYSDEMIELMGESLEESFEVIAMENSNFYPVHLTTLTIVIVGFLSVFWMSKLKKKGFYLYIFYSLLPIVPLSIYYRGFSDFWTGITWHLIFSALFVTLYAYQLKKMD